MSYIENNEVKYQVKLQIIRQLDSLINSQVYITDYELFRELFTEEEKHEKLFENGNIALDWIYDNYKDIKEIEEEFRDAMGDVVLEILKKLLSEESPQHYCYQIFRFVAIEILSHSKTINENWKQEIVISEELVDKIKQEIYEVK